MKLTNKAKKAFREWYNNRPLHTPFHTPYDVFMGKEIEMQIGVYQLFFDSVEIDIIIERWNQNLFVFVIYTSFLYETSKLPKKQTRQEAWIKGIEKANEIYNKR